MNPQWARSLRDQCTRAGVPFFFKQWGEWMPITAKQHADEYRQAIKTESWLEVHKQRLLNFPSGEYLGREYVKRVGKKAAGRLLDGREWNEYPKAKAVAA